MGGIQLRYVAALHGAAKDLEKHGFTHCQLASRETFDPGFEVQYVDNSNKV